MHFNSHDSHDSRCNLYKNGDLNLNVVTKLPRACRCFIGFQCGDLLVSGHDPVADSAFSASSSYNDLHAAHNARLHRLPDVLGIGAWSALTNDTTPFIQVSI